MYICMYVYTTNIFRLFLCNFLLNSHNNSFTIQIYIKRCLVGTQHAAKSKVLASSLCLQFPAV